MSTPSSGQTAVAALLDLRRQDALFRHKGIKAAFVAASIALIVAQQISFLRLQQNPDPFYKNVINLGASYQRYFAFFYYFGGFPVNLDGQKTATLDQISATLRELGPRLTPERSVYNRASIFLFYPDAFMKGRPDRAEMRTGHALWFTMGLVSVFLALCYVGLPLLGLASALLVGSDPFQVYELYHVTSSTIFPTVISTGLIAVAACVLLSSERFARRPALALVLVGAIGVVCALQYEIRLEGIGVFAGAACILACCVPQARGRRIAMALVFVAAAWATNAAINVYFRASLAKANRIVVSYGGKATDLGDPYYGTQWWALWSGLGDFDEKYGFLADDRAGISYYYGQNARRPSEQIHRNNFLQTIARDPRWFAAILAARVDRVLLHNTPYRLGYGERYVDIPVPPLLVTILGLCLLAAHLLVRRAARTTRAQVTLWVVPTAIGAVALGQLADYGLQFYCIVHLFIFAYVACVLVECALGLARLPPGRAAPVAAT